MNVARTALLTANDLALAYGHQRLLEAVTLSVAPGEKVGLVGRNGSGKTSLFRILTGHQSADAGEVTRRRGLRLGYLPQEFELDERLTARENIEAGAADLVEWLRRYESGQGTDGELGELLKRIESADGWKLQSRINAIGSALAAPPLDAPGWAAVRRGKTARSLCRALVAQPDLLLLDEPTNHLDAESILWLEDFLREFPGAVIFATHDRYFLDVIATRIIELADGRCFSHPGNYTAYLESKAIRQQVAEQSERRRQRFLREELDLGPRRRPGATVQAAAPARVLLPGPGPGSAAGRTRDGPADSAAAEPGKSCPRIGGRRGEGRRGRRPAMALPRTELFARSPRNAPASSAATGWARPRSCVFAWVNGRPTKAP